MVKVEYVCDECGKGKTLEKIQGEFSSREELGVKKYGTTVDRSDLNRTEWLQHLKEELMDGVLYAQRSIDEINEQDKFSLTSAYGDGWFDGFVAAVAIIKDGGDIEQYSNDDIVKMSESAESKSQLNNQNS